MNQKTKVVLIDIIHLASQALITDDAAVANSAIADIACAVKTIFPVSGNETKETQNEIQSQGR